jgi:hypothetical protein
MKYRFGFVSNSSSASFIIGLCLLTQEMVDRLLATGVNLEGYLFKISECNRHYLKNDRISVTAFDETSVYFRYPPDESKIEYVIILDEHGDEPDEDEWGEIDDVDSSYFSEHQLEIASIIDKNGGETTFGSGRNG